LAGCATTGPVAVDTSGLTAAIEHGQAASEVEQAARAEEAKARETYEEAARALSAKLKANLVSANEALEDGRLALGHGEVRIADSRLPDVAPDPAEMLAAEERRRLDAEAKVEQLQKNIAAAMGAAMSEAAQVARLRSEVDYAQAEVAKARQETSEALESAVKAVASVTSQIEDAKRQERARLVANAKAKQIAMANWAGGACGAASLVCLAGIFILPVANPVFKRGAIIAGVLCLVCFGFARFMASSWFMPLLVSGLGTAFAAWVVYEFKLSIRKHEAEAEANKAKSIVPYAAKLVNAINETDKMATDSDRPAIKKLFESIKSASSLSDDVIRHDLETIHASSVAQGKL
jgi:hypothetical protein